MSLFKKVSPVIRSFLVKYEWELICLFAVIVNIAGVFSYGYFGGFNSYLSAK